MKKIKGVPVPMLILSLGLILIGILVIINIIPFRFTENIQDGLIMLSFAYSFLIAFAEEKKK